MGKMLLGFAAGVVLTSLVFAFFVGMQNGEQPAPASGNQAAIEGAAPLSAPARDLARDSTPSNEAPEEAEAAPVARLDNRRA